MDRVPVWRAVRSSRNLAASMLHLLPVCREQNGS